MDDETSGSAGFSGIKKKDLLLLRDKPVFLDPQLLDFPVQRPAGNSEFRCRTFWARNFPFTFRKGPFNNLSLLILESVWQFLQGWLRAGQPSLFDPTGIAAGQDHRSFKCFAAHGYFPANPPADPDSKKTPTGTPTGTIANGNQTDFLPAPGEPAVFLFSTIDGPIAGWNLNVAVAQSAAPPSTQVTLASAQP